MKLADSVERLAFRHFLHAPRSTLYAPRCTLYAVLILSAIRYPLSAVYAVEVQPTRLELTVSLQEPYQGTLEVTNRASKAVEVRLSTGPYRYLEPGLKLPSAQGWFAFEPDRLTLAPGGSSTIHFVITPPPNVIDDTAGEYLAAILVDEFPVGGTASPEKERGSARTGGKITVVPRYAMPVYLKIEGREILKLEIAGLTPSIDNEKKLNKIEIALKNTGNVHLRPIGTLALFNAEGGIVLTQPVGKGVPILPTAISKIPTLLPYLSAGRYRAVVTMEPWEREMLQKEITFEIPSEES